MIICTNLLLDNSTCHRGSIWLVDSHPGLRGNFCSARSRPSRIIRLAIPIVTAAAAAAAAAGVSIRRIWIAAATGESPPGGNIRASIGIATSGGGADRGGDIQPPLEVFAECGRSDESRIVQQSHTQLVMRVRGDTVRPTPSGTSRRREGTTVHAETGAR